MLGVADLQSFKLDSPLEASISSREKPERFIPLDHAGRLPRGYIAVPIWNEGGSSAPRVCVILRETPDADQHYLLHQRDHLDAKVYLGCLVDGIGVLELLEIWIQSHNRPASTTNSPISSGSIKNSVQDARWNSIIKTAMTAWPNSTIATGFETRNPPPTFIDLYRQAPVHPGGWELCRDEDALRIAGLPSYADTRHRYLFKPRAADFRFVPLSADCPLNDKTTDYNSILPGISDYVPLNPDGSLVTVRRAGNLRLQDFVTLLGGQPFNGPVYGRTRFSFGPVQSLRTPMGGRFTSSEPQASSARFIETYLLKLSLIEGMIREVGRFTAQCQRPLLNLGPDSFAVHLDESGAGLPALWGARVSLIDTGDALEIKLPQNGKPFQSFLAGIGRGPSIYQPSAVTRGIVRGNGRLIFDRSSSSDHFPGKVYSGELNVGLPGIGLCPCDVIRIRIPLRDRPVEVFVNSEPGSKRLPQLQIQTLPDENLGSLNLQLPVNVPMDVTFEYIQALSSACDVYSLSMLAVDVLTQSTSAKGASPAEASEKLAQYWTDFVALAGACSRTYSGDRPLSTAIKTIFTQQPDWYKKLGPHVLLGGLIDPDLAAKLLTPELWFPLLAFMVRFIPGFGRDTYLPYLSSFRGESLDGIYPVLLGDVQFLLQRARSMFFGDWGLSREIGLILRDVSRQTNSSPG